MRTLKFVFLTLLFAIINHFANATETMPEINSIENRQIVWGLGFEMNAGEMMSKANVNLSVNASIELSDRYNAGIKGTAMWYDHRLNVLDPDKTYHVEGAYAGMFIEPKFNFGSSFVLSIPIYFGCGEIQYTYDSKYDDKLTWTEEIIDKDLFGFFEPGLSLKYHVNSHVSLSASVNYRFTSEITLVQSPDDMMNQVNFGFGFQYTFNR